MTNISFYGFRPGTINQAIIIPALLFLCLCFFSCRTGQTISQGISGKVLWFEGDLMPGIDKEPVEGIPVEREIYIYQPTTAGEAEVQDHVFYSEIKTEMVKKIKTGPEGDFKIKLDPGTYTLFVKETKGLFANKFNEAGYLNAVEVVKGEITDILIRIDYRAAY
jgi:hypothetical protein